MRPPSPPSSLTALHAEILTCERCRLAGTRSLAVPGEGSMARGLVVVGEAPGAAEDGNGRPFSGRTGAFLDQLFADLSLARSEVFITSSVKCRPPRNRTPRVDELAACRPHLLQQIELLRPRRILALGLIAARQLLGQAVRARSLSQLRDEQHSLPVGGCAVPVQVSYHPTAAMRFPDPRARLATDLALSLTLLKADTETG